MERNLSHDAIRELLGAYSIDAVERQERAVVERHLLSCDECRSEVESHQMAIAQLTQPGEFPSAVWERVELALEGSTPRLDLRRVPWAGRRSVSLRVATTWAAAAMVVIGLLANQSVHQEQRMNDMEARLRAAGGSADWARAVADPKNEHIVLKSPTGSPTVRMVVEPDGSGYVYDHDLDPLGEGWSYELWAIFDDSKVSLGSINRNAVMKFKGRRDARGFAVTIEPPSGDATQSQRVAEGYRKP